MLQKIILVFIFLILAVSVQAQNDSTSAGTVVLSIQNEMRYIRQGWNAPALVQAGTMLNVDDLVFPQNASLLVLCPDGRLKDFVAGELFANDKLNCAVPREQYVLNIEEIRVANIQRGGRQDPSIPYLISPRGTLQRSQDVTLVWNAPLNVLEYQVRVMSPNGDIFPSTIYDPAAVTENEMASLKLKLDLQVNTAYTVEICVVFNDLRQGCTTEPGWATGTNQAFYYVPDPILANQSLGNLISAYGAGTPESLYARAILLSQALPPHNLGFYGEAIDLLNQLISEHSTSPLAQSAEVYFRLGNLYRKIALPLSAARAFQKATQSGSACTETLAQAYLGLALTTPNPASTGDLLNQSLDTYHCLLQPEQFTRQYANICELVGDSCTDLHPPETFGG